MRCNICDAVLAQPDFNSDLDAYEPCGTCLAVINDAVGSFGDKPYAEEDQLEAGESPLDALCVGFDYPYFSPPEG